MVATATLVMARIERRPILSYGYVGDRKLIRLVSGVLLGFFCLSVLVAVLWKAGLLVVDGVALSGLTAWKYAVGWAFVFLLVGIFEESLLWLSAVHACARNRVLVGGFASLCSIRTGACQQ